MSPEAGTPGRLIVGRVAKAHGIRGEVSVEVHSDAPARFAPGARLRADPDLDLTVESARPHQGRMLVRFEEVPDRNAAEALRGRWLSAHVEEPPALPGEWSFWEHQLEGATVVDTQGRRLGGFVRAERGRAGDLWVVRTAHGEVMVPAVRDLVRSVDVEGKTIVLDPPEGLF